MKGDFSRLTNDPTKHYVGVLHQQGRVFLDSDWNEDVLERLAELRQELNDIIGNGGVPEPGTAFQISPGPDPADFHIAGGRCYVNGILCRLESDTTYLSQPDLLDPPPITIPATGLAEIGLVYLEVWHRLITYLEDETLREIALQGPDTATRLKTVAQVKIATLPSSVTDFSLANIAQFLPTPGAGTLTTLPPVPAPVQDLCQLSDPGNFTGRENRLYRVQIHDPGGVIGGTGTLIHEAVPPIFRLPGLPVIIHPVPLPVLPARIATFKWSRDNASFAVRVTAVQSDRLTLTLESLGRDTTTVLLEGDLVEISDDSSELGPARGHLTNLAANPDPDSLTVVLQDPLPSNFLVTGLEGLSSPPSTPQADRHLILRRWDGFGQASAVYDDTATPAMNLGDGVHIQFGGSDLRSGDYWQFTTRTVDGSVEALTNAAPAGIVRHWCPLAVLRWASLTSPPLSPPSGVVVTRIADFRNAFPALIHFPPFEAGIHVTGVSMVDPTGTISVPLTNDTQVQVTSFGRIDVRCDANIDPGSVARPTCFLTVETPLETDNQGNAFSYFTTKPSGIVTSNANIISWQPTSAALSLLTQAATFIPPTDKGILTRLTLKGNFIWDQATKSLHLDGEAFGFPGSAGSNISVTLPSGNNRRGGDFEIWFWMVSAPTPPVEIASLSANPGAIFPANTATTAVTLTLTAAAPRTGVPIRITNSNPNLVTLINPPTLVSAGNSSVSFTAQALGPKTNTGQTTITASIIASPPDLNTVSTILTVLDVELTGTLSISPASATISVGASATGTITLTGPAPGGIPSLTLSSSNPAIASVQPSVPIPPGNSNQSFQILGVSPGQVSIVASVGPVTPGILNIGALRAALVTVVARPIFRFPPIGDPGLKLT